MNAHTQGAKVEAGSIPVFTPVDEVLETKFDVPIELVRENVRVNMGRSYPRLHQLPEYGKSHPWPVAIVGSGPSLAGTVLNLASMPLDVMACGSAHGWLLDRCVNPRYAVCCDSSDLSQAYFQKSSPHTTYLLSTSCHPTTFDALRGRNIVMWNSYFGEDVYNGEPAIMGGCTVVLRAINLAIMLGYIGQQFHFFGFDGSFTDEEHVCDAPSAGEPYMVRVGGEDGRVFKSTPAWIAQATHFQAMWKAQRAMFDPVIHGDGMIAEIVRLAKAAASG